MSADALAAALAARIVPRLALAMPGNRLRILSKGGHINILQESEQSEQHPAAGNAKERRQASKAHVKTVGAHATADVDVPTERELAGPGQPCCQPSPARTEQRPRLPSSRAGTGGGKASTGNMGPEAGPGPQKQRSAVRCSADRPGCTHIATVPAILPGKHVCCLRMEPLPHYGACGSKAARARAVRCCQLTSWSACGCAQGSAPAPAPPAAPAPAAAGAAAAF